MTTRQGQFRRLLYTASGAAAAAMIAGAAPAAADFESYKIDPNHFSIGFLAHHVSYAETLGMFLEAEGSFQFDEQALALKDIEVTVEADSVFTNQKKRDEHLRSDAFLDADSHPEIRFVGTGAEKIDDTHGRVMGDLTVRGVTKPVTLEVTLNKIGPYPFGDGPPYVVGVSARTSFKRSEFGMTYAVENGWVEDNIDIIIEFEAIRQ